LSGDNFGFDHALSESANKEAIQTWEAWWDSNRATLFQ
jgi:hypothetical protein